MSKKERDGNSICKKPADFKRCKAITHQTKKLETLLLYGRGMRGTGQRPLANLP